MFSLSLIMPQNCQRPGDSDSETQRPGLCSGGGMTVCARQGSMCAEKFLEISMCTNMQSTTKSEEKTKKGKAQIIDVVSLKRAIHQATIFYRSNSKASDSTYLLFMMRNNSCSYSDNRSSHSHTGQLHQKEWACSTTLRKHKQSTLEPANWKAEHSDNTHRECLNQMSILTVKAHREQTELTFS